mmetsp:Transcript_46838/g.109645  ORF Transcript_46838/g.109645 Transcript_46838/m.109645 type:complete len:210 (+) Transcript_46838:20-649(+)
MCAMRLATALTASPTERRPEADEDEEPEEEDPAALLKPRTPKPGRITFNMQGAQKAMAAARTKVQVQSAVEAAKAKRLNVKDASTQTVRDPERQDGGFETIWRLRPRGMESFPHYAKPKKAKKRGKEGMIQVFEDLEDVPVVDPRDPSERKRVRIEGDSTEPIEPQEVTEPTTIDIEAPDDDDAEFCGGQAQSDPYLAFDDGGPVPDTV